MAAKKVDIMELRQLLLLKSKGESNRSCEKLLCIHRNTINHYVCLFRAIGNLGIVFKYYRNGKKSSISLGSHFENFISSSIASGKYSSASEVVRSALRLLESEENKLKELRNALIEGENSQMFENFNADKHLADLHQRCL